MTSRPLGAVVSVRFDPETARKVRQAARSLGLSLSEFVRRATLAAMDAPHRLGQAGEPPHSPYVIVVGTHGNLVWHPEGQNPAQASGVTVGEACPNPFPEPFRAGASESA